MSGKPNQETASSWRPDALAQRVARAGEGDERALTAAIDDFFLPDDARLDDRMRFALAVTMRGVVAGVAADVRRHAARLLADRGMPELGERVLTRPADVFGRLASAGVLREPVLMAEMIARVRLDFMQEALTLTVAGPEEPSLLVRLAAAPDRVVASAGATLLTAENRRRDAREREAGIEVDLPGVLHRQLIWWIAAAIRDGGADADMDRAIIEAALRSLSAHDDSDRVDMAAMRLAAAIEPRRAELPDLLVESLGDRRLRLFVALLAQALELPLEQARAITLERSGDRLWLALRALDLDRGTIARIALALAEADPARDIETFADQLDSIVAVDAGAARRALAPLWLHPDYQAAVRALAGAR